MDHLHRVILFFRPNALLILRSIILNEQCNISRAFQKIIREDHLADKHISVKSHHVGLSRAKREFTSTFVQIHVLLYS